MEVKSITVQLLEASEGFMLTQKEKVPLAQRVVTPSLSLAKSMTPEDWVEIPMDEADWIIREQEKERKEQAEEAEVEVTEVQDEED